MKMKIIIAVGLLLVIWSTSQAAEIFHAKGDSDYGLSYWQAQDLCAQFGAALATSHELEEARKWGFSVCKCGWTLDRGAYYPMAVSLPQCGGRAALHKCTWRSTWDAYCYRGDSIGNCTKPLGMEGHGIRDSQLASSSEYTSWWPIFSNSRWSAQIARIHNTNHVNAWMPEFNGRHQWIQVDLEVPTAVTGVITQGAKRLNVKSWVREYIIKYSKDGHNFKTIKENDEAKIFIANTDNNGLVRNMFPEPILARYVRIYPYDWHHRITLRFELLGCDLETYEHAESLSRDMLVINNGGVHSKPVEDTRFTEKEPPQK